MKRIYRKTPEKYKKRSSASNILPIKPGADAKLKKIFATIGIPESIPFRPDRYQLEAVEAIRHADCLVSAPTGSGKTWIAEQTIAEVFKNGGRAWYASPLKALSNSKYAEFSSIFGSENVGILTGDRKEKADAMLVVGTTEILRNQLYDAMHEGETLSCDLVILDEAHFLGDPDRGVVWEEIMIYLPPRIPILMLSATIGNADQIAGWLSSIRNRQCVVVQETQRPVPLYPIFFHPSGILMPLLSGGPEGKKERLYRKINEYLGKKNPPVLARGRSMAPLGQILQVLKHFDLTPALFFLKSRADCDYALSLCFDNQIDDPNRKAKLKQRIKELVKLSPHIASHKHRVYLEKFAIGSHHSGQLPAWKLILENLMTEGLLDAVFATSTVAAGVNFPARTVVFLNSDRFNGKEFVPMNPTEFHQMTGRAGRRGMDNIGFAVAIPGKFMDIPLVSRLVHAPPSNVISQIRINFSMVLNLLLSHTPPKIEELLRHSFATYLMKRKGRKRMIEENPMADPKVLWQEFLYHLNFLKITGYATEDGTLTGDGVWASQLRIDHPLIIAESLRNRILPESDPALLAGIMAAFVNEQEMDDRIAKDNVPKKLIEAISRIKNGLEPFIKRMMAEGFSSPQPPYIRVAYTIYTWASGGTWEEATAISEMDEGNLAMLILRTADHLRHIRSLAAVFPEHAETAGKAVDLILRDPIAAFYDIG